MGSCACLLYSSTRRDWYRRHPARSYPFWALAYAYFRAHYSPSPCTCQPSPAWWQKSPSSWCPQYPTSSQTQYINVQTITYELGLGVGRILDHRQLVHWVEGVRFAGCWEFVHSCPRALDVVHLQLPVRLVYRFGDYYVRAALLDIIVAVVVHLSYMSWFFDEPSPCALDIRHIQIILLMVQE